MAAGRRYTLAVTAAKFVLPVIALALLSLLVVLARSQPESEPLRFVDNTLADLAERQQLGQPRHAAVTQDGGELSITARVFVPDPDRARVTYGEDVSATLAMPAGEVYDITADSGELDEAAMLSTLRDNVIVIDSDGTVLRTDALRMRTDRSYLETLAPVRIDSRLGWIAAERMEIMTDPGNDIQTQIVFTGSVHLIYTP